MSAGIDLSTLDIRTCAECGNTFYTEKGVKMPDQCGNCAIAMAVRMHWFWVMHYWMLARPARRKEMADGE